MPPSVDRISCRPYNCGEAVVFVAAPSHGAVRFMAASAGGMRCRPYNCNVVYRDCGPGRSVCGRHEMPPLQLHNDPGFFPCLDPRSGSGMTDKSKEKDTETLDSCFSPSGRLSPTPVSPITNARTGSDRGSNQAAYEDPGFLFFSFLLLSSSTLVIGIHFFFFHS